MKTKTCKECGKELPLDNFYKSKKNKDGYEGKCKECKKKRQKEYYEDNKDEILKYQKEYRENNKDEISKRQKEYYKDNKDEISKRQKEYYEDNKDEISKYKREYYENNKDKIKEYSENNKDKILKYQKEYREDNKDEISKYKREYYKNNKDEILKRNKEYRENNPEKVFNRANKRRSKLENQGRGITNEQYKECNNWFDWKCAYSGEKMKNDKSTHGRTIDHIIALDNGGLNEPWNIVPMRKGYNSSKKNKVNSLDWYIEQEYFDEERLNKIVEWQIYAYEKWGGEEFGELILITDLLED